MYRLLIDPVCLHLLTVLVVLPNTIKQTLALDAGPVYYFAPACGAMAYIQWPAHQLCPMSGLFLLMSMMETHSALTPHGTPK